jgi:Beta-propeller repeat
MLALDRFGNLYIQGTTFSTDYPTTSGVFQPACASCENGNPDTYVTKLNSDGTALVYSTYLGGSDFELCGAQIAVDSVGSVYVNGFTCSTDFPTHNPLQGYGGGCDAFLTKLNPAGTALVYSTFLGGSDFDVIIGTAIDLSGSAYVSGATLSSDFPTAPRAFQTDFVGGSDCQFPPCSDAFVTKINPSGTALVYSTYLGGTSDEDGHGMAVDSHGNAFVAGNTTSTDCPIFNPLQRANAGGLDLFVTELNPVGTGLVFSSYLGGSGDDFTSGIALDRQRRNVYVGGTTASSDFPTVHAAQRQFGGGTFDAFVVKISPDSPSAGAVASGPSPSSTGKVYHGAETPSTNGILPSWRQRIGMARKAAR